jgi:dTDP-6-deoxy-L-talose 4-dehydrogenase (NAD+)
MKTVLLTGANGFVGRQVLKTLSGAEVSILPLVRSGMESDFDGISNVERVISSPDIFAEHSEWWEEQCDHVDIVIHAAWYVEPGKYLHSPLNTDCLIGSLNLARGAVRAGVTRFVGIGTCFEYDLHAGVLSTDTPLKPLTGYAGAKAALYMSLAKSLPEQFVEFVWCRLFYLFGEGEDERRLVPYLHKQLAKGEVVELTSGNQIRDFMDVSEAGRIIAEVALGSKQGPINICVGASVTIRQLAERIADRYGRRDLLKFGVREDNSVDPPCVVGIPNHDVPRSS